MTDAQLSPPRSSATLAQEVSGNVVNAPVRLAQKSAALLTSTVLRTVALNRERCKAVLLDTTYQVRHQVLCNFRDLLKSSLTQDPNVPKIVCKYAATIIDTLWTDIEQEIERELEASLLQQMAKDEVEGPRGWCLFSGVLRVRALFLHHYLPHDKSIWGKIKDPIYWVILCAMITPLSVLHFGIMLALLLMLLFPGPPDEFQLLNFIMLFKGLQFVSSGMLKCLKVSLVEYACYSLSKDNLLACVNTWGPPSTTPLDLLLDYVGTIVLTWSAASLLPRSKVYAGRRYHVRADDGQTDDEATKRRAGHRVHALLRYDLACFAVSLALLAVLTLCFCGRMHPSVLLHDPQFSTNIFWCSVFWSLSTFPFLPLNISWLFMAFSRSTPTGFNEKGACVGFEIAWKETKPLKKIFRRMNDGLKKAKAVGRFLRGKRAPTTEQLEEPRSLMKATADMTYSIYTRALEGDTSGGMVADMVPAPDQVMLIWDRY